jgi:hypothetical protein
MREIPASGITPDGREEQQKWWQQGNRETTREGGQERALGGDTKLSKKTIEGEGGGVVRDWEYHTALFQKGSKRRKILPTYHLRGAFLWNLGTQPE